MDIVDLDVLANILLCFPVLHSKCFLSLCLFSPHADSEDDSVDGDELDVQIQELEVRMVRMESIQHQILRRLELLEAKQLNPQIYGYSSLTPYVNPSPFFNYPPTQAHFGSHSSTGACNSSFTGASGILPPQVSPLPDVQQQHVQPQPDNSGLLSSEVGDVEIQPAPVRDHLRANATAALPSSEIPKQALHTVHEVLEANLKLRTESSAGTLCQKLAKEAFFGKEIMKKCTPGGNRQYPALPQEEFFELKKVMFRQFPRFHTCPGTFEPLWKKCVTFIEQACKRLRN